MSDSGLAHSNQATPTKQQPFADAQKSQNPYQRAKYAMSSGDVPQVPHDPYPMDGMTQFCRTGPPPAVGTTSDLSSAASQMRPSSRDSQSEYSNPTSYSSMEPPSGHASPTKQMTAPYATSEDEQTPAKKRGLFNSPFGRRRSKYGKEEPPAQNNHRNTWNPSSARKAGFESESKNGSFGRNNRGTILPDNRHSYSPEPVDPRANFQLNVGNNVFDITTPDSRKKPEQSSGGAEMDPIAQALEELKGVTKASSVRVSADRYAGLATPMPGNGRFGGGNTAVAAPERGAPPPSYDQRGSMLGAPPAAHTARAMQEATRKYTEQKQSMFNGPASRYHRQTEPLPIQQGSRGPSYGQGQEVVRSISPAPLRATSPRPGTFDQQRSQSYNPSSSQPSFRAPSPNPYGGAPSDGRPRANTTSPNKAPYTTGSWNSRGGSPGVQNPRAVSPQPHFIPQARPGSSRGASDMALQLAPSNSGSGTANGYYANDPRNGYAGSEPGQLSTRVRAKSFAEPAKNVTKDGRPILQYGKSLFFAICSVDDANYSSPQHEQCTCTMRRSQKS